MDVGVWTALGWELDFHLDWDLLVKADILLRTIETFRGLDGGDGTHAWCKGGAFGAVEGREEE